MPKRKKTLKNSRKGRKRRPQRSMAGRLMLGFKLVLAATAVGMVTGLFILGHDLLTQNDYFSVRQLEIEGMQRLTRDQVARQAGVYPGINILAANLTLARKRLLAHPWIAEAEVSREIPDRLYIAVKEHTALAAVDFGEKFLMNTQGEIFKVWEPSDPKNLPVISGLDLSDLTVFGRPEPIAEQRQNQASAPFQSVMRVLQLGGKKGSILPNRDLKEIQVDRQIGLTIRAFDLGKTINIGFSDYVNKYRILSRLLAYIKRDRRILDFERIDLNNLQRIVVDPVFRETPSTDTGNQNSAQ